MVIDKNGHQLTFDSHCTGSYFTLDSHYIGCFQKGYERMTVKEVDGRFPQMSPVISGFFAERDVHLTAYDASSCNQQ